MKESLADIEDNITRKSAWKHQFSHRLDNFVCPLDSGIENRSRTRNLDTYSAFRSIIQLKNINASYWVTLIQEELHQFERRTIIETRWVIRDKLDNHEIITRNKSILMVQGYNQEEGIDFDQTSAPIARIEAINILIAISTYMQFKLFLNVH